MLARRLTPRRAPVRTKGFSLLETAIALLIVGLFIAPLLLVYNNYLDHERMTKTYSNLRVITDSIQNYRNMTGHYPCPAGMTLPRESEQHGRAQDALCAAPGAPGTCNTEFGICFEESIRAGLTNNRVVVGTVPFRALQMQESDTLDAEGNRYTYAVTASMTDTGTIDDRNGAIEVRGDNNQTLLSVAGSAAFIVYSAGPDAKGAVNAYGAARGDCAGTALDVMNCHNGFATGDGSDHGRAVYRNVLRGSANNASFFDDEVMYFSALSDPTWQRSPVNANDIRDLSANNVGIGVTAPQTKLHVKADAPDTAMRAQKIYVNKVCDQNGENCFDPMVIAGDPEAPGAAEGILCEDDEYLYGISEGRALCTPVFDVVCSDPGNPVVIGQNPDRTLRCGQTPQNACPPKNMTLCETNDVSLPRGFEDEISNQQTQGDCRKARYKCQDGEWSLFEAPTGQCNFEPQPPTQQCGIGCGAGFSGTYCRTTTLNCEGETVTSDTRAQDCACVGSPWETQTADCTAVIGPQAAGIATRERRINPGTCAEEVTPWQGCTCTVPCADASVPCIRWLSDPSRQCQSGFINNPPYERQQQFNTATCQWADTGETRGDCACDQTPFTLPRPHDCTQPGPGGETYTEMCHEPDPSRPDIFTNQRDPANGCEGAANPPITTIGACRPRHFQWRMQDSRGSRATQLPPGANMIGGSCSCNDHQQSTESESQMVSCFLGNDPSLTIYLCKCLP